MTYEYSPLDTLPKVINRGDPRTGIDTTNWAIHILPYLEQQAHYDQYDSSLANRHPDNLPVMRTPLSIFKCPSDSDVPPLMAPTQIAQEVGPEGIATSSYKGVSGTRWGATNGFFDYIPFFGDYVRNRSFRGPFTVQGIGGLDLVEMHDIVDGTAQSLSFLRSIRWLVGTPFRYVPTASGHASPNVQRPRMP